ncbi:HORMA domain protein, putative [Plasmodium berghei]|uniref:HORMA domain protein, putative n=1 Tax=Plasmodium berghei TaxID=5821 RepID=A0A1D3SFT3_PLABE|nr:HORMA domain protein, putative [Plasmodium berghei]
MISRMSVRTHTNVEALTKQDSVNMMKNIIKLGISLVTYLRNLFEEKAYEEVCIQELKLKRLLPINSESHMIINWLEKGVFDAIEKEYLRILILDINDIYDNTLECYKFSFSYNTAKGGEIDITLETSANNDPNNLGNNTTTTANNNNNNNNNDNGAMEYSGLMEERRKNYNLNRLQNIKDRLLNKNGAKQKKEPSLLLKKNAKEKTYELLRSLVLLTQTLSPLPEKTYLSMKLLYYDEIVPYNYQPPYFRNPGNRDLLKFMSMPKENFVGKIDTGHHFLSIIVNSTCNNSTQENSAYEYYSNSNKMESNTNVKDMHNEYNQNNAIDNHADNYATNLGTHLSNNYNRNINKGYTDDAFHSYHHKYCNSTYSKYYNSCINKYYGNYTNIHKTNGYESEQSKCCSLFHDEEQYEYLKNYLKKCKRNDDKNDYIITDDDENNKTLEQNYLDHTHRIYKNRRTKHYAHAPKMEQYFTQNNEYITNGQRLQLNKIKKNERDTRIRKTNRNKLLAGSILNNTNPDDSIITRKRKTKNPSLARILKSNNYPEYSSNSESNECCVKLGKIISQNNINENDNDNGDDCVQVEKREIENYKKNKNRISDDNQGYEIKKNKYKKKNNPIQVISSNYHPNNTHINTTFPLKTRKKSQNNYTINETDLQSSTIKMATDKLLQEKEATCEENDIQMNTRGRRYNFSKEFNQNSSPKSQINTKEKIRNRRIDKEKQRIINEHITISKKNKLLGRIKIYITRYKILDISRIKKKIPTASINDINNVLNNLINENIIQKNEDNSYIFVKNKNSQNIKSTSIQKNRDLNYQNGDGHLQNGTEAHNTSIMLDQQKFNIYSTNNDANYIDKSSNEQNTIFDISKESDTKNLEKQGKDIDKTKYPISNVYDNSKHVTNPPNNDNPSYLPTNNLNKLSMQKGNTNEIAKIAENNELEEAAEINNDIQKLYDDVYSLCQKTKYVNKEIITKGLRIYPLLSKPLMNRLMKEGVLKKKLIKNKGYESNIFVPIENIFQGNKSSNSNENVLTENENFPSKDFCDNIKAD